MRARLGLIATALAVATTGLPGELRAATLDEVSAACVANEETCAEATKAYLATLGAANLPRAEYDDRLATLVSSLAAQANRNRGCDRQDSVAAAGIDAAAPFANSAEQQTMVNGIALSVRQCQEDVSTAAIQEAASGT